MNPPVSSSSAFNPRPRAVSSSSACRSCVPLAAALLVAGAMLAGCGGSGPPAVPDGYTTFRGDGVSFVHPRGWQVQQRRTPAGATEVQIVPPERATTPYAQIVLTVTPGAGGRFESLADQRRVVVKDALGAKVDSDDSVDLAGADQALRLKSTVPPGQGNDPVEVRSDSLDVLRSGGDVLVLVAAAPQRDGGGLDPGAVVDSFRLEGS